MATQLINFTDGYSQSKEKYGTLADMLDELKEIIRNIEQYRSKLIGMSYQAAALLYINRDLLRGVTAGSVESRNLEDNLVRYLKWVLMYNYDAYQLSMSTLRGQYAASMTNTELKIETSAFTP